MGFALLSGPADSQQISGTQGMAAPRGQGYRTTRKFILEGGPAFGGPEKPEGSGGTLRASNFPRSVIRLKLF